LSIDMSDLEFRSDNCGRAAPELIQALVNANEGTALGYGADETTKALNARLSELFDHWVQVFPIPTGTGANALALAAVGTPFGAVYCSPEAHINTSECNATSFFGSGLKVSPVPGVHGKMDHTALEIAISNSGKGQAHKNQPEVINLVQATDLGAVYSVPEVCALSHVARSHGLTVHMDGARFANALATLGCSPAELTWKAGVDILSFGVTKNGGLLADAIVVFNPTIAKNIGFHMRRAGMIWSKMRFASAQIMAYVTDDLWLRLARQSNAAATEISQALAQIDGVHLLAPVQANELFVEMSAAAIDQLAANGVLFYRRSPTLARLVCRWDTTQDEISQLIALVQKCIKG
jgi:threonine aldolase